jgi:hypothetical protein
MEKPTYAQAHHDAAKRLKFKICLLLEWSLMEYAEYQQQTGISYLYWYLPCDDLGRDQLERSKLYWNWYKTQWQGFDMAFVEQPDLDHIGLTIKREMYKSLHCPHAMAAEIKPNNVVLSELKKKVIK